MKPLPSLSSEATAMENAAANLKELAKTLWCASFGDYWRDVDRVKLTDGRVYAVRRVWLHPKRRMSDSVAAGRWTSVWGWSWLHGRPEDCTGRCTLALWVKKPEKGRLQE